jgi:broad specificity phosphatase PhoE
MMLTRLFLIRHGITEWNQQRRYCGRKDVGLSRQGELQAKELCKRLKKFKFDRIYSSDRKRALQTSRIIFDGVKVITLSGLREIDFGVFEGLRHKEIMKRYPVIYRRWLKNPFQSRIPKAESLDTFKKRVNSTFRKIIRLNCGKTIAVVCHGGAIAVFISTILKKNHFWRYVPAAASISMVEYKKSQLRVKKFNNTAHLR